MRRQRGMKGRMRTSGAENYLTHVTVICSRASVGKRNEVFDTQMHGRRVIEDEECISRSSQRLHHT